MGTEKNHYPGFAFAATELSAYAYSIGTFIISLKNGSTTQFSPPDVESFKSWLAAHHIRDVRVDDGIPPTINRQTETKASLKPPKSGIYQRRVFFYNFYLT